MTGTRIIVDGLWRCLCPSVNALALLRAVNCSSASRRLAPPRYGRAEGKAQGLRTLAHRARQEGCTAISTATAPVPMVPVPGRGSLSRAGTTHHRINCTRLVHSGATTRVGRLGLLSNAGNGRSTPLETGTKTDGSNSTGRIHQAASSSSTSPVDLQQQQLSIHALLRARPPYRRELLAASTPAIYAALRHLQDSPAAFARIHAFAQYLLDERNEAPTAALYEALVRANCHTNGSADAVRDVLRALKEANIEGTPSLYHGALSVLAVHPDYILRDAVLQEMKDRWIDLTPDGQQSVALGLLRDGQYERALNQLDEMTEASSTAGEAPVPSWLLDIYVYVLGQEGFLDDALQIVNHRLLRDDDAVSLNIWSFLLDACCRRGHYEGLTYVWNRVVRPGGSGLVTPSDAMALDVLNIAAQNGDANLAAAVMQMLAARGTKLSLPHFEAMLDCYAHTGAIGKALQALCIMHNAGIVPDQGSTRSIFLSLTMPRNGAGQGLSSSSNKAAMATAMDSAVASLFDLKKQYGSVPIAAFNVVLEAMLASRKHIANQSTATAVTRKRARGDEPEAESEAETEAEAALDLYRHVRQLCPAGPNRTTFRLLFHTCGDPHHLNFLVREMRAFAFRPDMDMVDRVVYENASSGSLEQALRHVFDLIGGADRGQAQAGETGAINGAGRAVDAGGGVEASNSAHAESLRRQPWISRRTAAALAKRCIAEEDERIWAIADASRERGRPMDAILREIAGGVTNPRAARNAYGVPHAIGLDDEEAPSPSEATLSG